MIIIIIDIKEIKLLLIFFHTSFGDLIAYENLRKF